MAKNVIIDISNHQGTVDFTLLKQAVDNGQVYGLIIRLSYGMFFIDPQAKRNVEMCNSLGIPYGTYHYSYARNLSEADIEVKGFMKLMQEYSVKPTLPCTIDMEDADHWKKNNWLDGDWWKVQSDVVKYFCNKLEEHGYYAMWYASKYWVDYLNQHNALVEKYDLWLAHWGIDQPSMNCGIWQYTAEGDLDNDGDRDGLELGFATDRLDLNIAYKDYGEIAKKFYGRDTKPVETPTVTVNQPSTFSVGKDVIVNGPVYADSFGRGAGMTLANHEGRITIVAKPNPYPYHIDGLGWVAENQVSLHGVENTNVLSVGDKVKVINPVDYRGTSIKLWYDTYEVMEVSNTDRIVIGVDGVVTCAISSKNVKEV